MHIIFFLCYSSGVLLPSKGIESSGDCRMMDEIQGYPRFLCFFWRVHGHLPGLLGRR